MNEKKDTVTTRTVAKKTSFIRKDVEVRSLLDQISKQEITVGHTMQSFLIQQAKDEGKKIDSLPVMRAQRNYSWDRSLGSRFIFSVMILNDPITTIYLYDNNEDSPYVKCLDGQQRLTTLWMFTHDKFKLDMSKADYNRFVVFGKEHSVNELDSKLFSELPQEWQDRLLNYAQSVVILKNCSEEQANGIYKRMSTINKPLRPIEVRKADMSDEIYDLIYNKFLNNSWAYHAMTVKSCAANFGLDISCQFLALLHQNKAVGLTRDSIDQIIHDMSNFGIAPDFKDTVSKVSQYLNKTTDLMIEQKKKIDETAKKGKRVKKYSVYRFPIFKNKTYIVMFLWAGYKAVQNNVNVEKFANWTNSFFGKPPAEFTRGLGVRGEKPGDLENVERRIKVINSEMAKLK